LVNFTPQPGYLQGGHPVPTFEGDQIIDVRWVGRGGNKKCTQNFSCKTVGKVLVRSLSRTSEDSINVFINPLNAELNPICYLLALLGAHHFLHVSRIRVKLLTFRLLMSYIYIWSTHS